MFRIVVIALWGALSVPCLVAAEAPSSGEGMFAIFFDYMSVRDLSYCPRTGPARCILGTLKPGQKINLLSSNNSRNCLSHAIKSFPYPGESSSFSLTKIDLTSCPDFTFDLAAITTDKSSYKRLGTLPSPSEFKSIEIDDHIRLRANSFKPTSNEHKFALASDKPELFRLPSMRDDSYIVVYQNSLTPGDQVHFLYSKGQVHLGHSAATIKSIFSLGEKYFIHYSFTCRIGCGYQGNVVVNFLTDRFEIVMFDASTSM